MLYPCRIIDSCVLISFYGTLAFIYEFQKLNINLYLMAWYLFLVTLGVYFTQTYIARKTIYAMPAEYTVDRCVTDFYTVVAGHIPNNSNGTQMIFFTQVKYPVDHFPG